MGTNVQQDRSSYRDLPQLLKQVREAKGESQEVAAVMIGTTRQSYGQWEAGKGAPTKLEWLFAIHEWAGEHSTWDEVYVSVARAFADRLGVPFPGLLGLFRYPELAA